MTKVEVRMTVIDAVTGETSYQTVLDDYTQEPEPVPQSISRFQARAALMNAGLLADVELAVSETDPLTQLAWADATEWVRDSPAISAIGSDLSLSEEDIDNLFIEAAKIKA